MLYPAFVENKCIFLVHFRLVVVIILQYSPAFFVSVVIQSRNRLLLQAVFRLIVSDYTVDTYII